MNLQERIEVLIKLGNYLQSGSPEWIAAKEDAERQNGWFTRPFIDKAVGHIADHFLAPDAIHSFASAYFLPGQTHQPKKIGLVMAGNIPLVGFHDWLCIFLCGHHALVKPSFKDRVLITHIIEKLSSWNPEISGQTRFSEMLKSCDAYIATGSNNTSRFFDYYFGKYPHIIRRNRSSVAVLDGQETSAALDALADDICLYFGLGCRNITKLYLPPRYDFVPLLEALKKYAGFMDHHKYKNNYDYQLALLLLNNQYYMTNGNILLAENESVFSPISVLHYEYYTGSPADIHSSLTHNPDIQCISGKGGLPFGQAQQPRLSDFADGVDTMAFFKRMVA